MSVSGTPEPARTPAADDASNGNARADDIFDDVIEPAGARALDLDAAGAGRSAAGGGWSPAELMRGFRLGGSEVPVIVASAAPLLNLAHELRQRTDAPDLDELRPAAFDAVKRYERDLASARISPERARAAHYIACATVDDVILAQPWSERMSWARSGLVSTFHNDVTGGDRVFDLLDHFHRSPGANKDLLLLIYLCLSIAFEGRTRVSPRGGLELDRIRESLYRTLLGQYGVFERELSPHWRGVAARHKPLRTTTLLWSLLSLLALVLGIGYLLFTLWLNSASDGTFTRLAELPPRDNPSVAQLAPPPTPPSQGPVEAVPQPSQVAPPAVQPPPKVDENLENLLAFLQPEVDKKLVGLSDANGRLRVRIANSGLFDVGSAEINDDFRALLNRIGGALASERYKAVVVGYTDNVPIRTVEFPSNYDLSEARAKAVGDILSVYAQAGAITTEGRADSDPIASNDTPEGREMNRRTEILVLTDPGTRLRQAGAQSMIKPPAEQPLVPPAAQGAGGASQ